MKIEGLVLDETSANILACADLSPNWFGEFNIPTEYEDRLKRIQIERVLYIIAPAAIAKSRPLVIKIEDGKIFDGLHDKQKSSCFDRILTIYLSKASRDIIPKKAWGKYVSGNKISIYATSKINQKDFKIYFDTHPLGENAVYAYDLVSDSTPIEKCAIDEDLFLEAYLHLDDAIKENSAKKQAPQKEQNYGMTLIEGQAQEYALFATLEDWYNQKLTSEQRNFVDKGYDEPVRLKGAAGTGKTLALAVKILKDSYKFEDNKQNKRLLFLTHSYATAQLVLNIVTSMDSRMLWGDFKHTHVEIVPLYDFAQNLLNYDFKNLKPLSTDGLEGRFLQLEIIKEVISEKLNNLKFRKSTLESCSSQIKDSLLNAKMREGFEIGVLNEFACILDAENVFLGSESAEKYIKENRESWQMKLDTPEDRRMLLELHNAYRIKLSNLGVLSMDQMIADLNRYLLSHEWNFRKKEFGFDAIFIDELHCFTKPERMVFHELYRAPEDAQNGKIPLFMAYDLKQSTNDVLLNALKKESISSIIKSTNVGKTELVELTKVFRYTPEIATFLSDIDGSFPALDLPNEWSNLNCNTDTQSGEKPIIVEYENDMTLIDSVFSKASLIAKRDLKKTVAVLVVNANLFDKYLRAGRINNLYEPITSRDDVVRINKLKGKCIFSMPEYVAGLQFDSIFILNLDKGEIDEENPSIGIYRKFVSSVYLAASRAKTQLYISCSKERGGASKILLPALLSGSLKKLTNM